MKRLLILSILIVLMAGCTKSRAITATPEVAACDTSVELSAQPVLYGLWMNENGDSLIVSETSMLLVAHDLSTDTPYVRETLYEVQSIDWVNGVLTLMMKSVKINGEGAGFDMPLHYLKVMIDGSSLMYSMGDETSGIPETAEIGPFAKK